MRPLVEIAGVAKRYPKVHRPADRLRGWFNALSRRRRLPSTPILQDINLTVHKGQSVAIVGENGAGKSTLLKLIAGVLHPSSGSIAVNGRIGALLELGAGFHPDYTGRRNVLLAGALMGLSEAQMQDLLPQIAAFAELSDKLDEPIKHYSSGMVVRLGFALIAHTQPDLLITDEVLAVGDVAFQKKCITWLEHYLAEGGTLLLVSHSMYHVQKLCTQACWLHQGQIQQAGDAYAVSQAYLAHHEAKLATAAPSDESPEHAALSALRINDSAEPYTLSFTDHAPLELQCQSSTETNAQILLARTDGVVLASREQALAKGSNCFEVAMPALLPGQYLLSIRPGATTGQPHESGLRQTITVRGESRKFGSLALGCHWDGQ